MNKKIKRLTNEQYFIQIANIVSKRSTCLRRRVGAIIVKDNRILTTGFNGAPKNFIHCLDIGCIRDKENIKSGTMQETCRGVHAEQNAIIQGSLYGVCISGSTLYCTHHPCISCSKMLINANIIKVVYINSYPDEEANKYLKEANIIVKRFIC